MKGKMIIRILVFFVCASLGTELRAEAFSISHCRKEIDAIPSGLTMHDERGRPVEITKNKLDCRSIQFSLHPEKEHIIFKLYTKQVRVKGRKLIIGDESSLRKSHFDASKPTYIMTHGWLADETSPSCASISDAYLINTDSNVIVVDWSYYSKFINYVIVSLQVYDVANIVVEFINWLIENGLDPDDVTLIGHSLGAHVMGIAGFKLEPKVNNVVGLDPALPMFEYAKDGERITAASGDHVQIIHTNAGALGYAHPCGHLDFYPNGGKMQPGCGSGLAACPCCHRRAAEYFAESISRRCIGITCDTLPRFKVVDCGEHVQNKTMGGIDLASSETHGMYYVWTNSEAPFC